MAEAHPLPDPEGARVRLLMVTAWMGQGRDEEALATCRLLSRLGEPELRQQARQLLTILEAPSLERPERWSMRLPSLSIQASGDAAPTTARRDDPANRLHRRRRRRDQRSRLRWVCRCGERGAAGHDPVAQRCVRMDVDLTSPAPDRLQLSWEIESSTGQLLPWQRRFEQDLHQRRPDLTVTHPRPGRQRIASRPMPSADFDTLMVQLLQLAGRGASVTLPDPRISLSERNWLVGVDQRLILQLDLRQLPEIPAMTLRLGLNGGQVTQTLRSGELISLDTHNWRWSRLGVGSVGVILLLVLSLVLQDSATAWLRLPGTPLLIKAPGDRDPPPAQRSSGAPPTAPVRAAAAAGTRRGHAEATASGCDRPPAPPGQGRAQATTSPGPGKAAGSAPPERPPPLPSQRRTRLRDAGDRRG